MSNKIYISLLALLVSFSFSQDRIRDFFEWGEYDSLIAAVEARRAAPPDSAADSALLCTCYSYLGVAYFAKGDIARARHEFALALACDSTITLDEKYVTAEMQSLFGDIRNDRALQRDRARREDSARIAREEERRENERLAREAAAIRSSFRLNTAVSAGFFCAGAAFAALAGMEYSSGKTDYSRYKEAAELGDKAMYDLYRAEILRKNERITIFSVTAALAGCGGAYFSLRAWTRHQMKIAVWIQKDDYAAAAAIDF